MFAERMIRLNLPYSEYWLPLAIGMGVGFFAIVVMRSVLGRTSTYTPRAKATPEIKEFDPFVQGSRSDQRRSFRRGGSTVQVYYAFPEQKNHPLEGWVVDRSMGGMCLGAGQEVPVGTVLSVLPFNAPPMTPWVEIEVRSCREVEGQYELGCQFVKVPPWSILLLFG